MDDKQKREILMILLGACIAGGASLSNSFILYNTQQTNEKSNIAQGLYYETGSLKNDLEPLDYSFTNNRSENEVFIQETPLYPETGMFFSFQKDIFQFDDKTSNDLYIFYNSLLTAENDRKLIFEIERRSDSRLLTPSEIYRQQVLTRNLKKAVNDSVMVMPDLKNELSQYLKKPGQVPGGALKTVPS
ncbi:MAG: hypothetical protein NTV68_10560 [Methanomicrobiales archaeon]|nr:hypothetical protein [Methanomicrobiales archaeon]